MCCNIWSQAAESHYKGDLCGVNHSEHCWMMIREANASDSFHQGILSHISSLLLPQLTTASLLFFYLSTFLLSAFFFLPLPHSCSRIHASLLAKARPAQLRCLASPLRLEQRWTVPRWAHMQPAGSVPGWLRGCWWRWMDDGWMMGMVCWHALWSLSANGVLLFCFPSACVDLHWQLLCSLKSVEPKVCLTEKKRFLSLSLSNLLILYVQSFVFRFQTFWGRE